IAAAVFGSLIAILEFLTGGVPLGLATLVALIGLGQTPDWPTLRNRIGIGMAAFTAAVIACFAYKLVAVATVFGTNELSVVGELLAPRMGGPVEVLLSDSAKAGLSAYRIDRQWLDANFVTGVDVAGLMLTYSSFFLGWGSHLCGAAFVRVPARILR